jgi:hypothetical protein
VRDAVAFLAAAAAATRLAINVTQSAVPITDEWRRDSRTLSAAPAILQRRAVVER